MIREIDQQEMSVQAALRLVKISKSGKEEEVEFMRNKKTELQKLF